mmetsp:Transcript_19263/g.41402  ORF Transcript_19263/g.41402 Transcript_19263/m.41402 type:complete len:338 (+) Transcript_19263:55-1068(+)
MTMTKAAALPRGRLGQRHSKHRLSISAETALSAHFEEEVEKGHHDHEDLINNTSRTLSSSSSLDDKSPMQEFPQNAALGSVTNRWGSTEASNFHVRGPNYLQNKKKVAPASDFVFVLRGCELLMTDRRVGPKNVGRNSHLLQGKLREKPTFIVNFRLPWGVLVFYYEIPERFLPYLQAGSDEKAKRQLEQALSHMSPTDRCVARFLMADAQTKNKKLKLIPTIVKGPWFVKTAVGTKPAIIGNKLPVSYAYQPASTASDGVTHLAPYLEADLNVAATTTARNILSLVKSHTECLTIDLGFVIQADEEDELPEQMLAGCRLHGVSPQDAPTLLVAGEQ